MKRVELRLSNLPQPPPGSKTLNCKTAEALRRCRPASAAATERNNTTSVPGGLTPGYTHINGHTEPREQRKQQSVAGVAEQDESKVQARSNREFRECSRLL